MNPNDPLSTLLASWTPRRPSPALKQRLFPRPPTPFRDPAPLPWLPQLAWATPALACLFLLAARPMRYPLQVEARGWPGLGTNPTPLYAAYQHASEQSSQNHPAANFTWTNHTLAPSTNTPWGDVN